MTDKYSVSNIAPLSNSSSHYLSSLLSSSNSKRSSIQPYRLVTHRQITKLKIPNDKATTLLKPCICLGRYLLLVRPTPPIIVENCTDSFNGQIHIYDMLEVLNGTDTCNKTNSENEDDKNNKKTDEPMFVLDFPHGMDDVLDVHVLPPTDNDPNPKTLTILVISTFGLLQYYQIDLDKAGMVKNEKEKGINETRPEEEEEHPIFSNSRMQDKTTPVITSYGPYTTFQYSDGVKGKNSDLRTTVTASAVYRGSNESSLSSSSNGSIFITTCTEPTSSPGLGPVITTQALVFDTNDSSSPPTQTLVYHFPLKSSRPPILPTCVSQPTLETITSLTVPSSSRLSCTIKETTFNNNAGTSNNNVSNNVGLSNHRNHSQHLNQFLLPTDTRTNYEVVVLDIVTMKEYYDSSLRRAAAATTTTTATASGSNDNADNNNNNNNNNGFSSFEVFPLPGYELHYGNRTSEVKTRKPVANDDHQHYSNSFKKKESLIGMVPFNSISNSRGGVNPAHYQHASRGRKSKISANINGELGGGISNLSGINSIGLSLKGEGLSTSFSSSTGSSSSSEDQCFAVVLGGDLLAACHLVDNGWGVTKHENQMRLPESNSIGSILGLGNFTSNGGKNERKRRKVAVCTTSGVTYILPVAEGKRRRSGKRIDVLLLPENAGGGGDLGKRNTGEGTDENSNTVGVFAEDCNIPGVVFLRGFTCGTIGDRQILCYCLGGIEGGVEIYEAPSCNFEEGEELGDPNTEQQQQQQQQDYDDDDDEEQHESDDEDLAVARKVSFCYKCIQNSSLGLFVDKLALLHDEALTSSSSLDADIEKECWKWRERNETGVSLMKSLDGRKSAKEFLLEFPFIWSLFEDMVFGKGNLF